MQAYACASAKIVLLIALLSAVVGSSAQAETERLSSQTGAGFRLNFGLSGSWANPDSPGQGFFFDVNPQTHLFWMSWFTFGQSSPEAASVIAHPGNQWFVALGSWSDDSNEVSLTILETAGGIFDDPMMVTESHVGSINLTFASCSEAALAFSFDESGAQAQFPVLRLTSTEVCDALADAP